MIGYKYFNLVGLHTREEKESIMQSNLFRLVYVAQEKLLDTQVASAGFLGPGKLEADML